jgi:predicted alpha/beta superfamily hydrolase
MVPKSIVVGISTVDRRHDLTYPSSNKQDIAYFPTTGGSEKFIFFIKDEVQPFIDSNYNSDTIKTIIDQSIGGLLATEILLKFPEMFDNIYYNKSQFVVG